MYYRFTNVGRSFFPVPRITPVDLGEGMELWKGFFQSPVIGWKPYLNVDGNYYVSFIWQNIIFLFVYLSHSHNINAHLMKWILIS